MSDKGVLLDKNNVFHSLQGHINIPDDIDSTSLILDYKPSLPESDDPDETKISRENPAGKDLLIDGISGRRISFEEAKRLVNIYAKIFEDYFELGWDDVLVICSPNTVDLPMSFWACHRLGGIISSANPSFSASELAYQLSIVKGEHNLKGLLVHPNSLGNATEALHQLSISDTKIILTQHSEQDNNSNLVSKYPVLEDLAKEYQASGDQQRQWRKLLPGEAKTKLAFISFSSGTTGLPKGVGISHYSICASVFQLAVYDKGRWSPFEDKVLAILPFYHIFGKAVLAYFFTFTGCPLVVIPKFSLNTYLETISKFKIRLLYIVPPIAVALSKSALTDNYDLSTVKSITCGAAPLSNDIYSLLQAKFPNADIGQGYGITETCTTVATFPKPKPGDPLRFGSVGKILPNIKIKIVNPETKLNLGFDQRGELLISSPTNTLGYINDPKATQESYDPEGYFHSGDEGYMDRDGYLHMTDRLKELIKTKGNQVAPSELEGHLLKHDYIADAAVIGIPDVFAGELPKAFIVLTDSAAKKVASNGSEQIKEEIYKFVADKKIKYKWLDGGIEFIDSIPKSPSGKLLRKILRDKVSGSN